MKKEKERKNWRENLVTSLEVPGDLAMKETIVTVIAFQIKKRK